MAGINFHLSNADAAKVWEWAAEQDKKWVAEHGEGPMGGAYYGAVGGSVTYEFTPTSIGIVVCARHATGEKLDLTDWSNF